MGIPIADNFNIQMQKPLDGRLKYNTLADMIAVADSTMYDGCLAYCVATDTTYQWKSTNEVDPTLRKWREFTSSAIEDIDQSDFDLTNKVLSLQSNKRIWNGHKEDWEGLTQAQRQAYAGGLANFDDDNPYTQPDIYSTSEVKTNKVWIDGKPIYRKVVDFGALPNAVTKSVASGISNIDTITDYYGIFHGTNANLRLPYAPNLTNNSDSVGMYIGGNLAINITTRQDMSMYSGYAVIEYTKTT